MSHRTRSSRLLYAIPAILLSVTACDDQPSCPAGEKIVPEYNMFETWSCVSTTPSTGTATKASSSQSSSSSSTASPSASAQQTTAAATSSSASPTAPSSTAPTTPPAAPPAVTTAPPPAPPPGPTCDAAAPPDADVTVIEKSTPAPSLGPSPSPAADGSYRLVQASFFRSSTVASAVRTLRATLVVRGRTLSLGAQDTTVAANRVEGFSFLFDQNALTKTCDGPDGGGDVSAWFFPFPVGGSGAAQLAYDSALGTIRLVATRSDGVTELVFAR
jgi:hypothetical protein